jgi:predicted ATPase/DNA-binding CsgD family transcriptional regulator
MAASTLLTDAGVSDREAEVLAFVGDHLTNAQIAGRMVISVRTVESHVSSLLRKLNVTDRRMLADLAASLRPHDTRPPPELATAPLPSPLTSFVGRAAERAGLAELLGEHRLVTAVGPGGVGKTRLALTVASDVTDHFADGARYVDLCPVTDAAMVGATVAGVFGFGEQPGRSPTDTVVAKLATSEALVVLDNCEHLLDGVSTFAERLLTACPRMTVLATSRGRLMVPYESVFPVAGLSLDDGRGQGDAVRLFVERAAMAGWSSPYPTDRDRIAHICAELDGIALSIELAAARIATLGLDGLEAGLSDQLGLLTGGPRLDGRHQSARAALDWSFGLLDETDRVVLRRASVFAAPFTAAAAATVTGFTPLLPEQVAESLSRLSDHNLLIASTVPGSTRYQMLETIRQYGAERIDEVGELTDVRARHLRWSQLTASRLDAAEESSVAFDEVADDLRAALGWAASEPGYRVEAHDLAVRLARLAYAHGKPSEAQQRFEEAAGLATDPADATESRHLAASVAWGRHFGNEAIRLFRAAADVALRAGDPRRSALEVLQAAQLMTGAPGIMSELPTPGDERVLLAEARELATGDVHVEATMLTITTFADEFDPTYTPLAERAVELAHQVGDTRLESYALDQVTASRLICGEYDEAVATVERRLRLLAPHAEDVELAWEYSDVLHMAPLVYLAAGDLGAARRYARQRSELSFFGEADHLAVEWSLTTAAIAGDFDEAVLLAQRFRRGWFEAGRPTLGGIGFAPAAAAMVHGIRGDEEARHEWLDIGAEMCRVVELFRGRQIIYQPTFEGMLSLHRGEIGVALTLVAAEPESFKPWHDSAWRPWYAAVWAEAGVLAGLPDRRSRIDRARFIVRSNPVAAAMVERAPPSPPAPRDRLLAAAATLNAAGCLYQCARTLLFAGGDDRSEGEIMLEAIGAAPMAS